MALKITSPGIENLTSRGSSRHLDSPALLMTAMEVDTYGVSNDERGWVMTVLSGVACVFGASVICVDIIVRQFPGKKDFRIQDSDTFLSASLSLSFGVMVST